MNHTFYSFPDIPMDRQFTVLGDNSLMRSSFQMPDGSQDFRRFISGVPMTKIVEPRCFYNYNNYWYSRERNGDGIPITSFSICNAIVVNPETDNTFGCIIMAYTANNRQNIAKIPYKSYARRKLLCYFVDICKQPGCPDHLLNELLFYLVQQYSQGFFLTIPMLPGWRVEDSQRASFVIGNEVLSIIKELYPNCVKNRLLPETFAFVGDLCSGLEETFSTHSKTKILLAMHVSSLLCSLLAKEGVEARQILVTKPSATVSGEKLIAMLKTQNYNSLVAESLETPKTVIEKILNGTNDGTVVFFDTSHIDEVKKIRSGLDCIVHDVYQANGNENHSHHQICIVTQFGGRHLPQDCTCQLSFDDVTVACDSKRIQNLIGQVDVALIDYISINFGMVMESLRNEISRLKLIHPENLPDKKCNVLIQMLCAHLLLYQCLNFTLFNTEDINNILAWLKSCDDIIDASQMIVDEFATVVNDHISNSKFKVIRKTDCTVFERGMNTVLAIGDELCFEPETIEQVILPQMTTTKNMSTLVEALKTCDYLHATNKNRRPIQVYNSQGQSTTLHSYSVRQRILSADNQHRINNLANEEFYFTCKEAYDKKFLPLVCDMDGRAAGRQLRMQDAENNHIYVTGQSGYGKSFVLSQLAAFHAGLGHRVIIFDTSSSFKCETLLRNLPQELVRSTIGFHSLETDGIPVNLFHIAEGYHLPNKKMTLFKVLSAATRELSDTQANALKTALFDMLHSVSSEQISTEEILAEFDRQSSTFISLKGRLQPIFDDIESCGMSMQTWEQFFANAKPITVISTETADTENGTQLIDMLIASLYQYQHKHADKALAIIIDELQNQNLANWSPISKILKEGRKDHIAFIGATQSFYAKSSSIGDAMSKADTKIFLKPTRDSEPAVTAELRYSKSESNRFDQMERGDCIIKGNFYSKTKKRNCPAIISGRVCQYAMANPTDSE